MEHQNIQLILVAGSIYHDGEQGTNASEEIVTRPENAVGVKPHMRKHLASFCSPE